MRGIDQVVALLRNDDRGHDQERGLSRSDPLGAQIRETLRGWIGAPIRREVSDAELPPRHFVRDLSGNRDQVGRGVGHVDVDEVLERCQRERGRRVDQGDAPTVPATTRQARPLAIEGGVRPAAESPDVNQL
jgi:hypothetical protein